MTLSLRGTFERYLPGWLKDRPGTNGKKADQAWRYLYTIATLGDFGLQYAIEGAQGRFPQYCSDDALAYIGRDRGIIRGPSEPREVYELRLLRWREDHKTRGNPYTLMRQLQAYCYPSTPRIRIVNNIGTWHTLSPFGVREPVVKAAGNWNWDGNTALRSRFWVIIYSDQGPWLEGDGWGDVGTFWGKPGTSWGTSATGEQVASVQAIVDYWRSATALCKNIIIAFDPDSFDPAGAPGAPLPDGTWGNWGKNSAGVMVPSRLDTARYWDGR